MVWFQCEDCGENLKKPKLPGHFRVCSAHKLSCIDCGETFNQQSVQSHTQCISEAEKYGPKNQGKAQHSLHAKPEKPKQNADVDINMGLASCPPWFCSLCNTHTTSKQTLLLHADGKKHRAKARAFHAAQKQTGGAESNLNGKDESSDAPITKPADASGVSKEIDATTETAVEITRDNNSSMKRKREENVSDKENLPDLCNGEVIQAEKAAQHCKSKKKKTVDVGMSQENQEDEKASESKVIQKQKIKWKKIITSTLESIPDRAMKIKKLQKLVLKSLTDSGVTVDKHELQKLLIDKVNSSSRFLVDGKYIRLVAKAEDS